MNTEITESIKGWVFYDGTCGVCAGWAGRMHGIAAKRGFHFVPLQAEWVRARLEHENPAPPAEMKLLTVKGGIYGGADALVEFVRHIWWAWPVFALAQLPGLKPLLRGTYRWLARNRHCLNGPCRIADQRTQVSARGHITSAFYELP